MGLKAYRFNDARGICVANEFKPRVQIGKNRDEQLGYGLICSNDFV